MPEDGRGGCPEDTWTGRQRRVEGNEAPGGFPVRMRLRAGCRAEGRSRFFDNSVDSIRQPNTRRDEIFVASRTLEGSRRAGVVRTFESGGSTGIACRDGLQGPALVLRGAVARMTAKPVRRRAASGPWPINTERRCDQSDSSTPLGEDRDSEGGPPRRGVAGDRLIYEGFDPGSE